MFLVLNLVLQPALGNDARFPLGLFLAQKAWELASKFEDNFAGLEKDCTAWKVTFTCCFVLYWSNFLCFSSVTGNFLLGGCFTVRLNVIPWF